MLIRILYGSLTLPKLGSQSSLHLTGLVTEPLQTGGFSTDIRYVNVCITGNIISTTSEPICCQVGDNGFMGLGHAELIQTITELLTN